MARQVAILAMLFWAFGGALVAHGSPVRQAVAAGVLKWAGTTTCGHPLHPGVSLRLCLTSGGGRKSLPTSATAVHLDG